MEDVQNITTINNDGIASYVQAHNDSWMSDEQRASVEIVSATQGKYVTLEYESDAYFPHNAKLRLNGHDISNITRRVMIDAGVSRGTTISLECYGLKGAKLRFTGQLSIEGPGSEPEIEECE